MPSLGIALFPEYTIFSDNIKHAILNNLCFGAYWNGKFLIKLLNLYKTERKDKKRLSKITFLLKNGLLQAKIPFKYENGTFDNQGDSRYGRGTRE